VARHQGLVVFVFGAIPGERVVAAVTGVRRQHALADVVRVLRSSPDRVTPPCPVYGRCGGCHWQHVAASRQLVLKREVVVDAIGRTGCPLEGTVVDALPAPDPFGYRWRGEFHRVDGGDPRLGFTERGGYRRLAVDQCPIHHQAINRALPALAAALPPPPPGGAGGGTLHLTVGDEGRELLVEPRPDPTIAPQLVEAASARLPDGPRLGTETTGLRYRELGFRASSQSFIQVNQGAVPLLYETVVEWLGPGGAGHVVDAYAGIGVLSCRLAQVARLVTAVEVNPAAAALCRLHADLNQLGERLRVRRGRVEDVLPTLGAVDAIVVDPPRAGLAPPVVGHLALQGPPVVVYVSCDPAALARDLHVLCGLGPYRLERLRVVDCFPQTYHVETVGRLLRT